MKVKIGIIVIGSLLWDPKKERAEWRERLDIKNRLLVQLPIRYGRKSGKNRHNTYSMVYSNNINRKGTVGKGFIIPLKNNVHSEQDFIAQMKFLSKAEEISSTKICASWGTVCSCINPFIADDKKAVLSAWWTNLVHHTRQNLSGNQREPVIEKFGNPREIKSIDTQWRLTINLDGLFSKELRGFDLLVGTSNAVRLHDEVNEYPTAKQIAKAIYDNKYFEYFLNNRKNSIQTFEDKKIAKILKFRYRVDLKEERKKCYDILY